jgi:hypothetical protein
MLVGVEFLIAFFCVCVVWLSVLTYRVRVHTLRNREMEAANREQLKQIEAIKNKLYGKERQNQKA